MGAPHARRGVEPLLCLALNFKLENSAPSARVATSTLKGMSTSETRRFFGRPGPCGRGKTLYLPGLTPLPAGTFAGPRTGAVSGLHCRGAVDRGTAWSAYRLPRRQSKGATQGYYAGMELGRATCSPKAAGSTDRLHGLDRR